MPVRAEEGGAFFKLGLVSTECTPSTGKKGHIVRVSAAQPQRGRKKEWGAGVREGGGVLHYK